MEITIELEQKLATKLTEIQQEYNNYETKLEEQEEVSWEDSDYRIFLEGKYEGFIAALLIIGDLPLFWKLNNVEPKNTKTKIQEQEEGAI